MKEKILKLTSVVIIICMIATIFLPSTVKSAQVVVSSMTDTSRGIGSTYVYTVKISGYSNLYCARGGAGMYVGTQLNDAGSIYYNSFSDIYTNQSSIRWLLDNMYLTEGTNSATQSDMKSNLKKIIKEYSTKKDSQGKSYLSKKIAVDNITDEWISKAVESLVQDKDTLYAVQQYVLWNFVKNSSSKYNNTLENTDGSISSIPNAKVSKSYYVALYISLREMAKSAGSSGYVSPNGTGGFGIKLSKDSSAKATVQSDRKTVLVGPYTLGNNHKQLNKTVTATINSNKVDKVEAVDANGKAVDIQSTTGKFYFKITYSKGFSKGVNYDIKVNVALKGDKTFANVLRPVNSANQPLISIRKERFNSNLTASMSFKEEITGNYSLEILKTGENNSPLSGVSFSIKEGTGTAKTYGPSSNSGIVSVVNNKEIKGKSTVVYTITELESNNKTYAPLANSFKVYVDLGVQNEQYKATKVYFDNGKTTKDVKLKNGTVVSLIASISGNKVTVTVPNKKITGNYSLEILKTDENNKALSGVSFKVKEGTGEAKTYGPTGTDGKVNIVNKNITQVGVDEYTISEIDFSNNSYITLADELKVYVTKEIKDYTYAVTGVSFEKGKQVKSTKVSLKDGTQVTVNVEYNNGKVTVTVPNKKITGNYSLDILKTDESNKPLSGVSFKVQDGTQTVKTYGPTGTDGKVNIVNNKKIESVGVDEYSIKEVSLENNQYITIQDELKLYVTKEIKNYQYQVTKVSFENNTEAVVTSKEVTLQDGTKVTVVAKVENGKITITVPNKKIVGNYSLELEKVDLANSNTKISGVTFKVQEGATEAKTYGPTGTDGKVTIADKKDINATGIDEYTISEVSLTDKSYIAINEAFKVYVTKEIKDYEYVATKVSFEKGKDVTSKEVVLKDGSKVTVTAKLQNGKITITVPNKKVTGSYGLEIEKVSSENESEKISGVTFKVKDGSAEAKTYGPTDEDGKVTIINSKTIKNVGTDEYTITEVSTDEELYVQLKEQFKIYVTKEIKDNEYKATKVSFESDKEVRTKKLTLEDGTQVTVKAEISGNVVRIIVPNKPVEKPSDFDIALRKYISEVKRDGKSINIGEDRTPVINEFSATEYENNKTAGYYHTKTPVSVKPGDTVVYTIRVYNEGNIDGIAKEITDYLPAGLEYIENSTINKNNNWVVTKNEDGTTTVKTNKLKDTIIPAANGAEGFADYANSASEDAPKFSEYVQIECKVKSDIQDSKLLVNVAEITNYGYNNENGEYIEANTEKVDIDSEENNVFTDKKNVTNIDEYYEKVVVPQNTTNNNHYKGIQDDDDFENIYVVPESIEFKFVLNKVDENGNPLIGADFTVERQKDDENKVLLNNEEVKGTYEVLESDVRFNKTYTYKVIEVESAPEYVNVMEGKYITLRTYMNEDKKLVLGNYNKVAEEDTLIQKYGFIINNEDGSIVKETETDLYEKIKVSVNNTATPAQIVITIPNTPEEKEFDLALRKFITGVTTNVGTDSEMETEVTNRVPVFKIDEKGNYVYEHTKEPLVVSNGDVVTYTLRVYNEGEKDGYAKLIKDDIPDGLEFLPEDELNVKYRWVMLDKYGKETTEVQNAEYIVSDYLSKEQEKVAGENLLKAFDEEAYKEGNVKEPDYKEVKVSFKVTAPDKSEEIIINQAQISEDTDKDGNDVTDKDSTPNKWIEGEDDQDIEKIKVQYFDLSLRKWVTKAITVENGLQTVTETNHKAEDDPEEIVKVDLKKSNINNVTVKFEYTIRVKNEGQIAGYAKEISDYIPEGLKFVAEDNPDWKEIDGKVVTEKLKDTLLKPGETAEVTITLTWINSEKNMGLKVNTAEISKDYNEYGSPDIDSTPNNKVPGEDDIDDAPVMLTVKTGQTATYAGLVAVILVMLAGGVVTIKKFVLK